MPILFGPPCRLQCNEEGARSRFFATLTIGRNGPREYLKALVAARGTTASVYRFSGAGLHSSLECDWIAMGARAESVIEVPVTTVNSILLDHGVQPRCGLLCINAEGQERGGQGLKDTLQNPVIAMSCL